MAGWHPVRMETWQMVSQMETWQDMFYVAFSFVDSKVVCFGSSALETLHYSEKFRDVYTAQKGTHRIPFIRLNEIDTYNYRYRTLVASAA